jgi:hypothetical protein
VWCERFFRTRKSNLHVGDCPCTFYGPLPCFYCYCSSLSDKEVHSENTVVVELLELGTTTSRFSAGIRNESSKPRSIDNEHKISKDYKVFTVAVVFAVSLFLISELIISDDRVLIIGDFLC